MNSHCPKCNAFYKVTEQHVGVRVDCRKCGSALTVKSDGLHLADAGGDEGFNLTDEPAAPRRTRSARNFGAGINTADIMKDIATWLYGAGTFLVILFLFLPLIDVAKVESREATLRSGELKQRRLDKALEDNKEAKSEDVTIRKKGREEWIKERERLQEAIEDAEISIKSSRVFYRYGMMFGFFMLTIASLGFLTPSQPPIRKVIGSITLLVIVVLNVIVSVVFSAGSSVK